MFGVAVALAGKLVASGAFSLFSALERRELACRPGLVFEAVSRVGGTTCDGIGTLCCCFELVLFKEDAEWVRPSFELLRIGEGENWAALTGLE